MVVEIVIRPTPRNLCVADYTHDRGISQFILRSVSVLKSAVDVLLERDLRSSGRKYLRPYNSCHTNRDCRERSGFHTGGQRNVLVLKSTFADLSPFFTSRRTNRYSLRSRQAPLVGNFFGAVLPNVGAARANVGLKDVILSGFQSDARVLKTGLRRNDVRPL